MPTPKDPDPVPLRIHTIRRQKVVLDSDLAALFGVSTRAFNQAIRRNQARFPADFVFELTQAEYEALMSQIVTSKPVSATRRKSQSATVDRRGGRRKRPLVFSEHGAIMTAMVLRSAHAVAMSVYVVRAFVKMREAMLAGATVLRRLAEIDRRLLEHDVVLREIVEGLQPLLAPPEMPPKPKIGFHPGNR
jgi:hypothetical protein